MHHHFLADTRARAEARLFKAQVREERACEREEAARVAAIGEKTARLKALRPEREAETAVTVKAR